MRYYRVVALAAALVSSGCPGLSTMLQRYGYTELTPPSTLFAPGTMVWVKHAEPFSAGVICTQRASLGADFEPLLAPTASSQINRATTGEFTLGAQAMSGVRGDARFNVVSHISVALNNASVLTVSDVDILSNVHARDPLCSRAIAVRQAAGFTVTMIAAALKADVTYRVSFDGKVNLTVDAKKDMLRALAPHLGIDSAGAVSDDSISGSGLFWGIIDDAYLAALAPDDQPGRPSGAMPLEMPQRVVAPGPIARPPAAPDVY